MYESRFYFYLVPVIIVPAYRPRFANPSDRGRLLTLGDRGTDMSGGKE
jgi:hypothetical protein